MSTPSERLTQARLRAGHKKRSDAIEAHGWQKSAYNHHENGIRAFDVETAKQYARAYKVTPGWLLGLEAEPGEPIEVAPIPNDKAMEAVIRALLLEARPGQSPSDDLVRELVSGLRGTLAILASDPDASHDHEASRLVERVLAYQLGQKAGRATDT